MDMEVFETLTDEREASELLAQIGTMGDVSLDDNADNAATSTVNDFHDRLLNEVQERPVLYTSGCSRSLRTNSLKENAWHDISLVLGIPARVLRERWKAIRDRYGRYIRAIRENPSSRTSETGRNWRLFEQLSFLKPSFEHEPSSETNVTGDLEGYDEKDETIYEEYNVEDINLIHAFKEHEVLYNTQSRSKDTFSEREQAWREICRKTGASTTHACRNQWRTIRDRYSKYLRDISINPNGCRARTARKWPLFHEMSFLRPFIIQNRAVRRRSQQRLECAKDSTPSGSPSAQVADFEEHPVRSSTRKRKPVKKEVEEDDIEENNSECTIIPSTPPRANKMRKSMKYECPSDDIASASDVGYSSNQPICSEQLGRASPEQDDCHNFGMVVASRLRGLTAKQRAFAQMQITSLLYNLEFPPSSS